MKTKTKTTKILAPELLGKLDAWWRAANYLSVGQIYLYDNPLLKQPLKLAHIKPRLLGHWGTTPGLNFIYVHLNRVIKEHDLNVINITGPGHERTRFGGERLAGRDLHRSLSPYRAKRGRDATVVQAILLPRRHSEPRRAGNAGFDSRGRRLYR